MKTPFAVIAAHAVTFLGCKDLDSMKWGGSVPHKRKFCLFTKPPNEKCASSEKKNTIFSSQFSRFKHKTK